MMLPKTVDILREVLMFIINSDRSEHVEYNGDDYPLKTSHAKLSEYPGFAAPPHWHDDLEFIAVTAGLMRYTINDETVDLRRGDGVIVNSRQLHFGHSVNLRECEFACVLIHPRMLRIDATFDNEFVRPVLQAPNLPYIELRADVDWQRALQQRIVAMADARDALDIMADAFALWRDLVAHVSPAEPDDTSGADLAAMKRMMRFVHRHYAEPVRLADIARAGAVGTSKCCVLFARYVQCPPNEFLIRTRLEATLDELTGSERTVAAIAHDAGFRGASYFTQVFRAHYGCTPTEYRRRGAVRAA
ncbi:MAG: AraC family transcriptional regulator [Bifidobacterium sp.]|nr:AraC family transcriptional regulator [Bifidobacterium sp.]